jgi:RNA polymerase sigma-70 factor, ECF subfamily
MPPLDDQEWLAAIRPLLARLYRASDCARWEVSEQAFDEALRRSVHHRFPDGASSGDVARYLESLHVTDVALACACRAGHAAAWDHFVLEYRPSLYAAARSIAGDAHRELADSLYAELYGVSATGGERQSLLAWFHGRSRLITWLRSVLVQRHIDNRRAAARFERIGDDESAASHAHGHGGVARSPRESGSAAGPHGRYASAVEMPDPDRRHAVGAAQAALDAAAAALEPRDRLRLRLYYGEDLTLAQIGRITGEHEATVSRKLARARKALRLDVMERLRAEHGLSDDAINECIAHAAEAPELHLTRLLSEE